MLMIDKIARKWQGESFNYYIKKGFPYMIEKGKVKFIKHQVKVESFKLNKERKAKLNNNKACEVLS